MLALRKVALPEVQRLWVLLLDGVDKGVQPLQVCVESVSDFEGGYLDLFYGEVERTGGVALGFQAICLMLDHFANLQILAGLVQKVERRLELFTLLCRLEFNRRFRRRREQPSHISPLHFI